ncbi:MAG: hypothetical protein ACRC14_17720, partial [Paracoccaceae bacterium]
MRPARPADRAALLAFLRAHEAGSMFPLVNVLGQGIAMRVWVAGRPGVSGMVGLTETGMVLVQWPGGDWGRAAEVLRGAQVEGLLGPADQVRGLRAALGLHKAEARLAADEPGFTLALDDMQLPGVEGYRLASLDGVAELVESWRAAYQVESLGMPQGEAGEVAQHDVSRWIAAGSHRVLFHHDRPVGLTGINARLPAV